MAVIRLNIAVDDLEQTLLQFNKIKVYRSVTTDPNGSYEEITDAATRLTLESGKSIYTYIDNAGDEAKYYRSSFFQSVSLLESSLSDPTQGESNNALSVLTVDQLKSRYLFGLDLTDDTGTPIPDESFQFYIEAAVNGLERELDISILPKSITNEKHDYYREDYDKYIWLETKQKPIISLEAVRLVLPGAEVVENFPAEWFQIMEEAGQIQLIPGVGTAGTVLLGANGAYIPLIYGNARFIPQAFRIDYTAGFTEVPSEIVDVIGKIASFGPLNIAGDLLGGAGIASQSLSIDGLSQSFNTTSSATNAGYGARLTQYEKELKRVIPALKQYYGGLRMKIV